MSERPRNVLVTGAAGFIGSHVVRLLGERPDIATTALVRRTTHLWRWRAFADLPACLPRIEFANLQSAEDIESALLRVRPDVVVHLAMAYQPPGAAPSSDIDDVNLRATVRLAERFFALGGRRFVLAGTCFEYGHVDLMKIPESTSCRPTYGYAIAKAKAGETALNLADRAGCEALVLRVFSPYGPLEDAARIVPQMVRAGLQGRELEMSPGDQVRDYTTARDVAAAFVAAATSNSICRGAYNVCTGVGHSLRELSTRVSQSLGRPLSPRWGAQLYRPGEMMRLVGDPTAAARDLGWAPSDSLSAGLQKATAWWRGGLAAEYANESRRASA